MGDLPEPNPVERAKQSLKSIKCKFVIISCKGGVDKTSVVDNLATDLADVRKSIELAWRYFDWWRI